MKTITKIDANKLAQGIQSILLDIAKTTGAESASYPVKEFERMIMEEKQVSKTEAARVTEKVISTGIIRWEIFGNNFVL